jgi:hypothetical protein
MKSNSNTLKNAAVTGSNAQAQCKRKPTQKQQILKHLQDYPKGITQAEAARLYNCWRLADVVFRLKREDGYSILTIDEPNKSGHGTHARYVLMSEPTTPLAA